MRRNGIMSLLRSMRLLGQLREGRFHDGRILRKAAMIILRRNGLAGGHHQLQFHEQQGMEQAGALLAGDGISDRMPFTAIPEWPFPIHMIGIVSIGLHLIDNLRLDVVTEVCRREERWEFLMTVAPMRVPGGTGSPVNPIAIK